MGTFQTVSYDNFASKWTWRANVSWVRHWCKEVRQIKRKEQEGKKLISIQEQNEKPKSKQKTLEKDFKSQGRPTLKGPTRGNFAYDKVLGCRCWLWLLVLACLLLPSASACTTSSTWNSTTTNFTSPFVWAPLGTVRPWSLPWDDLLQPCGSWCEADGAEQREPLQMCSSFCVAEEHAVCVFDATQCDSGSVQLLNLGWKKFKLLVVWPVVELYPYNVDNPLFNWCWLWVVSYLFINIRYGMNLLWKSKTKNRKISKRKQIRCKTKLLTSQRRPVAFSARFCRKQRLCKARVKYRRVANTLFAKRLMSQSRKLRHGRPVLRSALFRSKCADVCHDFDTADTYQQWLQENCNNLVGGSAGSAATRRLRKQKAAGNAKMASLVQMFKEFVNQSGGVNLEPLTSLLEKFQQTPKKKRKKRVQKTTPGSSGEIKTWKGHRYQVCPTTGWWTWIEKVQSDQALPHRDNSWYANWPSLPKSEPQIDKTAGSGQRQQTRKVVLTKPHKETSAGQTPVTGIRPQDWSTVPAPKMVKLQDLITAVSEGNPPPGNLVEVRNSEQLAEVNDVWDAFGNPAPLTLMFTGNFCHKDQTRVTVSLIRGTNAQKLETVGLWKLNGTQGPWVHNAEKITKDILPKSDKIEVRLVAPAMYRAQFLPQGHSVDMATFVVSSLASASQVPVSQLTGGQWVQRQQGQDKHLVGYLRLKPETVAKLLPFSGHNAVFVNKVKDRSGGPIFWIKRLEDETREAYFRRVSKMQKERKQSIVWRQGCGHDLGFGRTDTDENPTPSRIVTIRGLPEHWDDEDIVSFMHTQKWTNFVVTSRKKKCWYGKGFPPPDQKDHSWWAFTVDDEPPWTISIQVLPHRPRGPMMCQTTRGPARNNPSKDITMADSTMQLEPMVSTENRRGRSTTRDVRTDGEASEKRSRSPKNKPDKGPDFVLGSQEPPGDAPPKPRRCCDSGLEK